MTEIAWAIVFERLNKGEAVAAIAKELQVDRSTVWRKYQAHLESQATGRRRELAQLQGAIESLDRKKTGLEKEIGSLGDEYAKRERKLVEALRVLRDELEATEAKIAGLKKIASERGLGLEEALGLISEIKDLRDEVRDLTGERDSLSDEVARGEETISKLKAEKSDLEGGIKIRSSYSRQLQQQINQMGVVYNRLQGWWQRDGIKLAQTKEALEAQLPLIKALASDLKTVGTKLKKEVENLASKKGELEHEIGALMHEVGTKRNELAEVGREYEIVAKRLKELHAAAAPP